MTGILGAGSNALSSARNALPVNGRTVSRLHGMFGVAALVAAERGIGWRETETWTVEKHFLGKSGHRSTEKKRLTKAMCETLGWRPVTLDEADALALLSWMMAAVLPPALHRQGPLFQAALSPAR